MFQYSHLKATVHKFSHCKYRDWRTTHKYYLADGVKCVKCQCINNVRWWPDCWHLTHLIVSTVSSVVDALRNLITVIPGTRKREWRWNTLRGFPSVHTQVEYWRHVPLILLTVDNIKNISSNIVSQGSYWYQQNQRQMLRSISVSNSRFDVKGHPTIDKMHTLWNECVADRQTDRQTGRETDRQTDKVRGC